MNTYVAIDLKSFYASVECIDRGLDVMTTNLLVADNSRGEKTICLAVSPSLKSYGLGGRCRLYEAMGKIREANKKRCVLNSYKPFSQKSSNKIDLDTNIDYEIDFIIAKPRMARYIEVSSKIYEIYLKYVSKDDIHVYSIDEVFIDLSRYLKTYRMSGIDLVKQILNDIYTSLGIVATAGIATNLYLAKVAMDIVAKHVEPDENGFRIAYLDEKTYREKLWDHKPLLDFWRVGRGYVKKLEDLDLYTMGDIARYSMTKDYNLYKLFGVNAELLIDHAWGYESCSIKDIKAYKPKAHSLTSGQVLHDPYSYEKARIVIFEMVDSLSLDLVAKALVCDQIVINIGYDISNIDEGYGGSISVDFYGRQVPKPGHGTINLDLKTSSSKLLCKAALSLYDRIVDKTLLIRRFNITFNNVVEEYASLNNGKQLDLFSSDVDLEKEEEFLKKEKKMQKTILDIKNKYGKNSILRGTNLLNGATGKARNKQIGGHKA